MKNKSLHKTIDEIVLLKSVQSKLYDRTVAIFIPNEVYRSYTPKATYPNVDIFPLLSTGGGVPHYSVVTLINSKSCDPRAVMELQLLPAVLNGKKPIMEYIEIES